MSYLWCFHCFACKHKTVRCHLEHSWVSTQSNISYISFAQKPHTSCPEVASAAFVSRGTASFCRLCLFSFPTELNHCLSAWKKKKSLVNVLGVYRSVGFCSVGLLQSSIPVWMSHTQTVRERRLHLRCCSLGRAFDIFNIAWFKGLIIWLFV